MPRARRTDLSTDAGSQDLVRGGPAMIIDRAMTCRSWGQAADRLEAVALAERERPEVALMDVHMPRPDGIEAIRRLAGSGSPARIMMLTMFDLIELRRAAADRAPRVAASQAPPRGGQLDSGAYRPVGVFARGVEGTHGRWA